MNTVSFSRKRCVLFFVIFFAFFVHVHALDADGFGSKGKSKIYEGAKWKKVYYDMNGLYFTAMLPNYSGTVMKNAEISLEGNAFGGAYIVTTFDAKFKCPKSIKEFRKKISKANPKATVRALKAKKFGAIFAVEFTHKEEKKITHWRMFCTKNRFIKIGTDDRNEKRRGKFFNSLYIK